MVLGGRRLAVVPEPLAVYRMHGSNASADRPAMLASATEFLCRVHDRDGLSPDERAVLVTTLAEHRRILARDRLKAALLSADPAVRTLPAGVMNDPGQPRRSRLLAAGAAILPRSASRTWRRLSDGTWTGPGGRRLPKPGG